MTSLDIILPAYNPLPGWEELILHRFQSLSRQLCEWQIRLIIVDDGSSVTGMDYAVDRLKKNIPQFNWISYTPNKGKGYALRKGMEFSTADLILFTDIDWPYTEESMLGLLHLLNTTGDAVIGVRNEDYYERLPPARRLISKWLRKMNAALLHLKTEDTQTGLKGFHKELKSIFLNTTINRYLFDLEFIYMLSRQKNIRLLEFPVALREGIHFRSINPKIILEEAGNFFKIWLKS